MLKNINRGVSRLHEVLQVSITLLRMWPIGTWLRFWATHKPETVVTINKIKLTIRAKNFFTKVADISMAYECILRDDYLLKNREYSCGGVVLDIGAHIGSFSLAVAGKYPKVRILAFEPSPNTYLILKKNIVLNNYKNITPFNKAVSSSGKKEVFYIDPTNSAADSMYTRKGCSVEVSSISLEKIFQSNKIKKCIFLKMDCEGAEYNILLNTPDKILRKIRSMAVEYHHPPHFGIRNRDYTLPNLIKRLKQSGFTCKIDRTKSYQGIITASR